LHAEFSMTVSIGETHCNRIRVAWQPLIRCWMQPMPIGLSLTASQRWRARFSGERKVAGTFRVPSLFAFLLRNL
jgi:hypothetical protein